MSKYLQAFGAIVALVASVGNASVAQNQARAGAPIQPSPRQMQDERDPLIQWPSGQMDVREMLQALDQASPQQILIGEGVSGRVEYSGRVEHSGQEMRLSQFLDVLCQAAGLTWGYLNRDTIVVLRARPQSTGLVLRRPPGLGIPLPTPRIAPTPRLVPLPRLSPNPRDPFNRIPGPLPDLRMERGNRPDSIPEDAQPGFFNGTPFYIIPLQPELHASQAPLAPEIPSPASPAPAER